jgi:predicted Fe-Mo cluster-binding NifX family protein
MGGQNMKIGIPLFGKRVSPHFATAPELLVVLVEGQTVYSTSRLDFSRVSLTEKKRKIRDMGIETLFCGGIDNETKGWFEQRGIRVIGNTMGEATEVISSFLRGTERQDLSSQRDFKSLKRGRTRHE